MDPGSQGGSADRAEPLRLIEDERPPRRAPAAGGQIELFGDLPEDTGPRSGATTNAPPSPPPVLDAETIEILRLAAETGTDLSAVLNAADRSARLLGDLRSAADALQLPDGVAVVVTGSLGRLEVTTASDVDFVVASVWEEATEEHARLVGAAIDALGYDRPREGGALGRPAHARELSALTGRIEETNRDFTLRLLLLLESRAVTRQPVHKALVAQLLDAYLRDHTSRTPPRFLLNDIVRYWRTLCVDFEGKMAVRRNEGWVIRNAKLRTLRKLLFAGGLIPVLECFAREPAEQGTFLLERLSIPPAARIAAAGLTWRAPEAAAAALHAYGRMLTLLDDAERRSVLEELDKGEHETHPLWREIEDIGAAFQRALEKILFTTPLQAPARAYAIF